MDKYTEEDIHVLTAYEHIRTNSSMYIGSCQNTTHLVEEVLDNSLDESLAGYATAISLQIDTVNKRFFVADNGRGIPIANDTPVTISTKLFSGGKFKQKKTVYDLAVGLHGIGLVAVNFLSKEYNIEIYRDSKHAIFKFEKGKLINKEIKNHSGKTPFSTCISFVPDKEIFESLDSDIARLRLRLKVASAHLPNCVLALTIDDNTEVFRNNIENLFKDEVLDQESNIYKIETEVKKEEFNFLFAYSDVTATPKIISSVNFLPLKEGGTHVNYIFDILKEFFSNMGKKFQKNFQPNDCLVGLRSYIYLLLRDTEFSNQSKEKLTCRKSNYEKFEKKIKDSLSKFFKDNPEELQNLLNRFELYRKTQDSKSVEIKNNGNKRSSPKVLKLKDCTSRTGELFIVEGDSAAGTFTKCRDPRIHAIFAMKGKSIPNITTKKNALENIEVKELIKCLGTGIEPNFNIDNIRYSKIIIATDSDADGGHIFSMITMVCAVLMPELLKQGKIYMAQSPLFCVNDKKKKIFYPLWTKEEREEAIQKGLNIMRAKGLGEFSSDQLREIMLNPNTRRLYQLGYSNDMDYLIRLFSNVSEKKALLEE